MPMWPHFAMHGWSGWWWMPFHPLFSLLFLILAIGVVVTMLPRAGGGKDSSHSGLDVLEQRYARGEIQREEYLQKKRDLS